jgi:cell division protein FtsW (lipid II flippase)
VFVRAGMLLPDLLEVSRIAVWAVVGLSAVAVVLNLITPSKWERRLWAPVALMLLATSLVVALGE